MQAEWTEETRQRITTENTTLKQRVRQLTTDNRTLDERLEAAPPAPTSASRTAASGDLEVQITSTLATAKPPARSGAPEGRDQG